MRLSDLTIRFRRNRAAAAAIESQQQEQVGLGRRQTMTLDSMARAAHSRSLKGGMRVR